MGKLLDRLAAGPVICAEGYLFEFERRGYLQAGAFVPEVVLEEPDMVAGLHREYVHAGSDVVEAFTYYAHREKLAVIGREGDLERLNRQALRIAKQVGAEHDSLVAGNICNTNVYEPDDPATHEVVRDMFTEQVGWAAEAGVDFVIAETIDYPGEALLALEAIKAHGLDAVVTLTIHREPIVRGGVPIGEACRRLQDAGADVVGLNCIRGPATMLPLLGDIRAACDGYIAALPVPYRTTEAEPTFQSLTDPDCDLIPGGRPFPTALGDGRVHDGGGCARGQLLRHLLRLRTPPRPRDGRGPRPHAAGEPVQRGYEPARLLRHQRTDQPALPGVRQRALARNPANNARTCSTMGGVGSMMITTSRPTPVSRGVACTASGLAPWPVRSIRIFTARKPADFARPGPGRRGPRRPGRRGGTG
jgi:betaine-homocysteine S-methyltransferase